MTTAVSSRAERRRDERGMANEAQSRDQVASTILCPSARPPRRGAPMSPPIITHGWHRECQLIPTTRLRFITNAQFVPPPLRSG